MYCFTSSHLYTAGHCEAAQGATCPAALGALVIVRAIAAALHSGVIVDQVFEQHPADVPRGHIVGLWLGWLRGATFGNQYTLSTLQLLPDDGHTRLEEHFDCVSQRV